MRVPSRRVHWEDPYGGISADIFCLSESGNEMTQYTEMLFNTNETVNLTCVQPQCI